MINKLNFLLMPKTTQPFDTEQIVVHIKKLDPAIRKSVETIRQIILSTDKNGCFFVLELNQKQ